MTHIIAMTRLLHLLRQAEAAMVAETARDLRRMRVEGIIATAIATVGFVLSFLIVSIIIVTAPPTQ